MLPAQPAARLYRRLAWTFTAELSSFERKQYVSLSHEPNKAMNLNSYIGLMGGSYREIADRRRDARWCRPSRATATSTSRTRTTC